MFSISDFLIWLVVISLTTRSESFLTVRVEITPELIGTSPSSCTSEFINDLESNLTEFVLSTTQELDFLSDFTIPSGLYLSYFDNATSPGLRRSLIATTKQTTVISPFGSLLTCSSRGCTISVGICLCKLCSSSRRRDKEIVTSESLAQRDEERMLAADWSEVGIDVTHAVQPMVRSYVGDSVEADGCLGDPKQLIVNVTYLSDVPFSTTMEQALVRAFEAPPQPAPAPTPQACCTQTFASCITSCGTTEEECQACSETAGIEGAVWLPQGPPTNPLCVSRGSSCLGNATACCDGLSCVGDQFQQECMYAAADAPTAAPSSLIVAKNTFSVISSVPTLQPSTAPASTHLRTRQPTLLPTDSPTQLPVPLPTQLPTHLPTEQPTNLPTGQPTHLPTRPPTHLPTRKPTHLPTRPPTHLPTRQPTHLPTRLPTLLPSQLSTNNPTQPPTSLPTELPTLLPNTKEPTPLPFTHLSTFSPSQSLQISSLSTSSLEAQRISVGSDDTGAIVDESGNLYVFNKTAWSTLRTGVKDVAVVNASSIYIVGLDNNVYRLNGNNWDQIGYYSSFIATAADATVAVVSSVAGFIWVKVNYDDIQNWSIVPGVLNATGVAVVSQSSIYYVTADGSVYRTDRISLPVHVGHSAVEISASGDGTVVIVSTSGEIWQKLSDDDTDAWFQVPGKAENVAVLSKNSRYIIDTSGSVQLLGALATSTPTIAPSPMIAPRSFSTTANPEPPSPDTRTTLSPSTQRPTRSSTPSPTTLPTAAPTQPPTFLPNQLPSQLPTSLPTLPPTALPTALPTPLPSQLPTLMPTTLPTPPPTLMPTTLPTPPPTLMPTTLPTPPPTPVPTTFPTALPTPIPTALPTPPPTPMPTTLPTPPPTPIPTRLPTPPPTPMPTAPAPAQPCLTSGNVCPLLGLNCCAGLTCKTLFLFITTCQ